MWLFQSILVLALVVVQAAEDEGTSNPRLRRQRRAMLIKVPDITEEELREQENTREHSLLEVSAEDVSFWSRELQLASMSMRRELGVGSMSMDVRRLASAKTAAITEYGHKGVAMENTLKDTEAWIRDLESGSMSMMEGLRRDLGMGSMSMPLRHLAQNTESN